jgi:hypothetical protein
MCAGYLGYAEESYEPASPPPEEETKTNYEEYKKVHMMNCSLTKRFRELTNEITQLA